MSDRRDKIAEKVMMLMIEQDPLWTKDPKPLAARAYAVANAMVEQGDKFYKADWDAAKERYQSALMNSVDK